MKSSRFPSFSQPLYPPPALNDDFTTAFWRVFRLFIITLFIYITAFGACQAYRRRNGAWSLTFTHQTNGNPLLRIDHPKILGPNPVTLEFPGEVSPRSDLPITAVFNQPITNRMPFGPILFIDSSILPGTVTLNAFGHAVEMIPRTLFLDFKEFGWPAGSNIIVAASNKPAPEKLEYKSQQWKGR